ncbi:MAG TPA: cell wall-binding repeat-containing protein [Solirubrobacterales bacterium]|nr:cell wall-binding repeat-containing protein [Solirubrobacterales bacterium]
MLPKRPINADVPAPDEEEKETTAAEEPKAEAKPAEQPQAKSEPDTQELKAEPKPKESKLEAPPKTKQPRAPKSPTPKVLAGLVVLALVFIVVAIVGSSGGKDKSSTTPAPAPAASGSAGDSPSSQTAEQLGYPGFATDNTTRVGGSDPAANAAGAALAVFPSTAASQQPAAVTLVNEEDWAGAIAASVLMAPPVRAPLLFSTPDELPEASEEALAALDPQGSKDTGGASLFAIGTVSLPSDAGKTSRVDSGAPASTAAQIATLRERLSGRPPEHIVIASSSQPDFAMPAAAWAARSGDPVLYAEAGKLSPPTAAVLKEHPKTPVFVLGPNSAISKEVLGEIAKISKRVKRVAGADPVANAIALARYRAGSFGWNINDPGHGFVLARSDSPADAAAAAPLSAAGTWGPLLLTDGADTLPAALRSYLLDVKPGYTTDPTRAFYNHVWVIGDEEAISVDQQAEVNELAELAKIGSGE